MLRNFLLILLTVGIVFGGTATWILMRSPTPDVRHYVPFSVTTGESFYSVASKLKDSGLIRSQSFFYYLGRLTAKSGQLKAGEYELNTEMSTWEVLKVITGGRVKLFKFTILEGWTMFQVAQKLDEMGFVDKVQFLEITWDPLFLKEMSIPSITAEGYLFPETYMIARGSSPRTLLKMFIEMFWSKVPQSFISSAQKGSLSLHEAVIMASMIEKETGHAGEMPLISSVFHNRLNQRMKLQSDPTAIYDIMPYGGLVSRDHLFRETPFNTYRIQGLPLTPISNPSLAAIQAALFPKTTKYVFFVSRRDGSHYFSETYDEHRDAIQRFLKGG